MPAAPAAGSSVPFFSHKQPQQVLEAGVRLDGRGYEEFRAVCKQHYIHASSAWQSSGADSH